MVNRSRSSGESLKELKKRALPTTPAQVLPHILAGWNISPEVFLPIKFAFDEISSIKRLAEPLRTKAELLKQAILLSRLAVGGWHEWDLVELPDPATLKRLGICDPLQIVDDTKTDVRKLAEFSTKRAANQRHTGLKSNALGRVNYLRTSLAKFDLLELFIASLGVETIPVHADNADFDQPLIVDALHASTKRIGGRISSRNAFVLTSTDRIEMTARLPHALALPASCGKVQEVIAATQTAPSPSAAVRSTSWLGKVLGVKAKLSSSESSASSLQLASITG